MNSTEFCSVYERDVVPTLYGQATTTYRYLCLALFIITFIYFFVGMVLFLRYKNSHVRLQSRSTLMMICLILSFMAMSAGVFLREFAGRDKSQCIMYAWTLYVCFVFSGGAYVGNLYGYIYKLRTQRDQGIQFMRQQRLSKVDVENGGNVSNNQVPSSSKGICFYFYDFSTMLKYTKDGRVYIPGQEDFKDDNASAQGSEATGALSLSFFFNDTQSVDIKWTLWDRVKEGIIYPLIIIYLYGSLVLILGLIRIYTDPVFVNGCHGCQLQQGDYIIIAVTSALNAFWIQIASYGIRNEPDPLGVVSDARLGWVCFLLTIPVCILQIYDPGNYYKNYTFNWDMMFCFISCIIFYPVIYGHLIKSYWERSKSRVKPKATSMSNELSPRIISESPKHHPRYSSKHLPPSSALDVNLIIQEPRARNALLEHMINELSSENLVFVFKVRAWKDLWSKDSTEKVNRIAANLYNEYILRSGKTQINIPNAVYSKIEKTMSSYLDSSKQKVGNVSPMESEKIPITVFDGCEAECIQIIKTDSLPRFRLSALFKERIIETGILDKILS